MDEGRRKEIGAYYTPDHVVRSLVAWAARNGRDRMLDPSCGDGRFLATHSNSLGVDSDPHAMNLAASRAPFATLRCDDFFAWAGQTGERFECAVGNPPFIRYQRFSGDVRRRALELCAGHGARFSGLTSSWAPFIVGAAALLKPGGRMAFVVPAEIGHAPYARPLLRYLMGSFDRVQVVAVRDKLFPELSEDCWLLFCDGYGGGSDHIRFSVLERFDFTPAPPRTTRKVLLSALELWNHRLRPFLLPNGVRDLYGAMARSNEAFRLGQVAKVGIGYVTGANEFFHLRLSQARALGLQDRFLKTAVRNGRYLRGSAITRKVVGQWLQRDEPVLLLALPPKTTLPAEVKRYLDSDEGQVARTRYKCRTRSPWYTVPNVSAPDAFLSYMTNGGPALVANYAKCVATNSVHVVHLVNGMSARRLLGMWRHPITQLSCELEGHPLGGGLLKLEPREAARVLMAPSFQVGQMERRRIRDGIDRLWKWRHYG